MATERRIIEICRTCIACPSQWDAKLDDGQFVYLRYRWGNFEIGIGATEHDAVINSDRTCVDLDKGEFDGFLSDPDMMAEAEKLGFSFTPNCWKEKLVTEFEL